MIEFIVMITEELYCIVPKDIRRDIQCLVTFVDKISLEQCIHIKVLNNRILSCFVSVNKTKAMYFSKN